MRARRSHSGTRAPLQQPGAFTRASAARGSLGIMVCPRVGEPPISEKSFIRRLSVIGRKLGLIVFAFFPHRLDWERKRVVGYRFRPDTNQWEKRFFPLPDLVYDRCFYADGRTFAAYRQPIRRLMSTPGTSFLGYGLRGKWQVYQMLKLDEQVARHIPETELLRDRRDISRWLDDKGELFLKPHGGSQGKGVLHVATVGRRFAVKGKTAANRTVGASFATEEALLRWVEAFTGQRRYLIQRYLVLKDDRGGAFDIRALVQKDGRGQWSLTGLAARHGEPGSVTSNLHGGGSAAPAAPFLRHLYGEENAAKIIAVASKLALRIPEVLEQSHGRLVELGIDFGVDPDGAVWILEANSKPGRAAFASLEDEEVRLASIRSPILYANYMLDCRNGRIGRNLVGG